MKKLLYLFIALLLTPGSFAQGPKRFNYQAVLRDASGGILVNKQVILKLEIIRGELPGTVIYSEEWNIETNALGLINLEVGEGNPDEFEAIGWSNGPFFISVTVDGEPLGTSQLLSVPFAMQAQHVSNDQVEDDDADPLNEIQDISLSGNQLSISRGSTVTLPSTGGGGGGTPLTEAEVDAYVSNNGYQLSVDDGDIDATNEIQDLSLTGDVLKITGNSSATNIDLAAYKDDTDDQTLTEILTISTSAGNKKITDLLDPVSDQGAATKKYVDDGLVGKVDVVPGKGLSDNNYTDAEKTRLAEAELQSNKNRANGYPGLDTNKKIDVSQLPAITINNVYTVTDQAAQLALTASQGDIAIRTDISRNYIHNGGSAGDMTDWTELASSGASVTSVSGKTGAVVLGISDITSLQTALDAKANTSALATIATSGSYNDLTNLPVNLDVDATDDLTSGDLVNDLTTGGTTKALTAEQGKALKTLIDTKAGSSGLAVIATTGSYNDLINIPANLDVDATNDLLKTDLVNDLTTGGTTKALTAEQGKTLKGHIDSNSNHASLTNNPHSVTKTQVGLDNVDNTSDTDKPISTATQTALDLKADIASLGTASTKDVGTLANNVVQLDGTGKLPAVDGSQLTGLPSAPVTSVAGLTGVVTLSGMGLDNVDNTSDADKPISTATQTALDLKADLDSPTFTGTPTLPTGTVATTQLVGDNSNKIATTAFVSTAVANGHFSDENFRIHDNIDNTKRFYLEVGGITTGTTRTLTVPDYNGFIATLDGIETFTGKTLVSPTVSYSPTAAGATWTDLGTVTTADINGGTIDGVVINGSSIGSTTAGSGAFTTLAAAALANMNAGLSIKNGNTSAGTVAIYEDSDDGSNKLTIQAQAMTSDYTLTLPADDGNASQVLTTDGNGALSWTNPGNGDITGVGSMGSGDVFSGSAADGQWLGLGASFAGRIQFENETTDEILLLDANVGIGTLAPSGFQVGNQVPVSTTRQTRDNVRMGISGGIPKILLEDDASDIIWQMQNNNGNFWIHDAISTKIAIDHNGNVGIGTTTPNGFQVSRAVTADRTFANNVRMGVFNNTPRLILEDDASLTLWQIENTNGNFWIHDGLSPKFTIDNDGNVGIGSTPSAKRLSVEGSTPGQIQLRNSAAASGKYWDIGVEGSNNTFIVYNQDYAGLFLTDGGSSWTLFSDIRLKENIQTIDNALEGILSLRGVKYRFKKNEKTEIGVIAQDVQLKFPEIVSEHNGYLGVAYDRLIPVLIEAIKEQQMQIEDQEKQLESLQKQINELKALIGK